MQQFQYSWDSKSSSIPSLWNEDNRLVQPSLKRVHEVRGLSVRDRWLSNCPNLVHLCNRAYMRQLELVGPRSVGCISLLFTLIRIDGPNKWAAAEEESKPDHPTSWTSLDNPARNCRRHIQMLLEFIIEFSPLLERFLFSFFPKKLSPSLFGRQQQNSAQFSHLFFSSFFTPSCLRRFRFSELIWIIHRVARQLTSNF